VSAALQSDIDAEVEAMLKEGVIQPSQSKWAAPLLLVRKKDGRWRFCIDYHELNKVTKKDCYPMSNANEGLNGFGGSKFRSKFDAASGYWQLPMEPGASEMAAFVTKHGLYKPVVMPFGLNNAPATFQRMMDSMISEVKGKWAWVHIDDLLIYSLTWEEHLKHMEETFKHLHKEGITLPRSNLPW